jgi:hypothetical protein
MRCPNGRDYRSPQKYEQTDPRDKRDKMSYKLHYALLLSAALLAVSNSAPAAKADEWDKETVVTFSAPVQVSDKTLPTGTYVFKLADSPSSRDIVEIFSSDRQHLITTFLATATTRVKPADSAIVTLEHEATDKPAVKSWFYPGDMEGREFPHSK